MSNHAYDSQLQDLVCQHRALERELNYLVRRAYLTPPEQTRVVQLKKLKLSAKDRIAELQRVDVQA